MFIPIICLLSVVTTITGERIFNIPIKSNHGKPVCWPYDVRPHLQWVATPETKETVIIGQRVELTCSAIGIPAPRVRWVKTVEKVEHEYEFNISNEYIRDAPYSQLEDVSALNTAKLIIPIVTEDVTSDYTCIASNGIIEHEKRIFLYPILPKATNYSSMKLNQYSKNDLTEFVTGVPSIHTYTAVASAKVGYSTVLRCRADRRINGTELVWKDSLGGPCHKKETKFELLPTGDLFIRKVEWDDIGYYTCSTRNQYGRDKIKTLLLLLP